MAVRSELTHLDLCSGYGGFSLALKPFGVRTVCYCERDSYAAATLVARMEEERLDKAPIWDDLATFDGKAWSGRVDIISAGFPCQPFSQAGQQRGLDDDRWLWPGIQRIVSDVRPGIVILENVPGVVKHGLPRILHDLAQMGFDANWGLLSAEAIGAPHRRERFWLLAYTDRDGLESLRGCNRECECNPNGCCEDVGHADSERRPEVSGSVEEVQEEAWAEGDNFLKYSGENVADPQGVDERKSDDEISAESREDSRGDAGWHSHWPPYRNDYDGWVEWISQGGPQPAVRRESLRHPKWLADALHLGGNGLVPQCATEAIRQLANRASS